MSPNSIGRSLNWPLVGLKEVRVNTLEAGLFLSEYVIDEDLTDL